MAVARMDPPQDGIVSIAKLKAQGSFPHRPWAYLCNSSETDRVIDLEKAPVTTDRPRCPANRATGRQSLDPSTQRIPAMTRDRTIALCAFIGGVAIGTLAVAFTGSKNAQLLNDLAGSNRRARDKSEFLTGQSTRARTALAL